MISESSKTKTPKFTIFLIAFGTLLNLAAILGENSGALVAVGCSLVAVGAALKNKSQRE